MRLLSEIEMQSVAGCGAQPQGQGKRVGVDTDGDGKVDKMATVYANGVLVVDGEEATTNFAWAGTVTFTAFFLSLGYSDGANGPSGYAGVDAIPFNWNYSNVDNSVQDPSFNYNIGSDGLNAGWWSNLSPESSTGFYSDHFNSYNPYTGH
ncbi:MAG: hypothetical protein ACK4I0_00075 [Brevundimonas sp.]|uniref:hypothetical protein n=1 Tax=Brevundimonas sp. TaxID=1871086 RepID=UPI00391885A1